LNSTVSPENLNNLISSTSGAEGDHPGLAELTRITKLDKGMSQESNVTIVVSARMSNKLRSVFKPCGPDVSTGLAEAVISRRESLNAFKVWT